MVIQNINSLYLCPRAVKFNDFMYTLTIQCLKLRGGENRSESKPIRNKQTNNRIFAVNVRVVSVSPLVLSVNRVSSTTDRSRTVSPPLGHTPTGGVPSVRSEPPQSRHSDDVFTSLRTYRTSSLSLLCTLIFPDVSFVLRAPSSGAR